MGIGASPEGDGQCRECSIGPAARPRMEDNSMGGEGAARSETRWVV